VKQTKYNLTDFYPDCMLPDCTEQGEHQHILPKQLQLHDIEEKYLYTQGGVGSGKSLPLAIEAVWLSLTINENKGVVSRLHYDDLFDSTWRDIKAVIKRLVKKEIIPEPKWGKKTQGDYTEILFHNDSEMKAIQGKNWSRGLGASHGWFLVDDAMESYEEFFIGNETNAGLLSRLRLPHVRFDPRTYHAELRPHGSLRGMVGSNPPPIGHWLHKLFGMTPGVHKFGPDKVCWIQSATSDNPFAGSNYAMGLMAAQDKMGRSKNVARRVIFGESIPAYGGSPVYPQFEEETHVGVYKYDPTLPVVTGWDFGFHHPAVVFNQLHICEFGTNHFWTISEIADAFSLTVYDLYKSHYQPHIAARYGNASLILHAGDRAGFRSSSSNKDRRGDMKILRDEYHMPFMFRWLDLIPSLQYMRALLKPKKPCPCGQELIGIDAENCPVLIGALQGGYKYTKSRDGKLSEKPMEDRYFADIACAWRYAAENFVKWGIPWEYQKHTPEARRPRQRPEPWAWMEMTDAEMGHALTN
jgi:hypothetical protein